MQLQGLAVQGARRPVPAEYNARFDIRGPCQNEKHIPYLVQDGGVEVWVCESVASLANWVCSQGHVSICFDILQERSHAKSYCLVFDG